MTGPDQVPKIIEMPRPVIWRDFGIVPGLAGASAFMQWLVFCLTDL
jgi:hypothetical protein